MAEEARKRRSDSPFAGFVDEVRAAADLVSLVSSYVSLKRSGSRLKGLCPFHQEKTPSFYVDDAKQLFYCFGCGQGGDAFKFLMLQEKLDFLEAARMLGERHGIRAPERDAAGGAGRERLASALEAAGTFFGEQLFDRGTGEAARAYLKSRGVTGETARRLALGYAPAGWEVLRGALAGSGFAEQVLVEAGLLVKREGGGAYDRFRNRVMFPIRSVSGRCVGFGGRALGEEEPKYLNSPESALYRKSEHLFGLDRTAQAVRALGAAVLVEGYMDFLSAYQAGVENVVATLGTAFTDAQAGLLRRFCGRVVLSFDPDAAGLAATRRALEKLLPLGFEVRIVDLPTERDPDAFIRDAGATAYRHKLDAAPGWFECLFARAAARRDIGALEAKVAVVADLGTLVLKTPNRLERSAQAGMLAQRLGVDEEVLRSELRRMARQDGAERPSALRDAARSEPTPAELMLLRALLEQPDSQERWLPRLRAEDFHDLRVQRIVGLLHEGLAEGEPRGLGEVLKRLGDEPARDLVARLGVDPAPPAGPEEAEACVQALERRRLVRERRAIQQRMEGEKDPALLGELLQRKIQISKRIDALS